MDNRSSGLLLFGLLYGAVLGVMAYRRWAHLSDRVSRVEEGLWKLSRDRTPTVMGPPAEAKAPAKAVSRSRVAASAEPAV